MGIKRIFIVISAIFAASAVFADNSSVTSKKYVDDLMSGYQGKLPGSGANTLMIYDNNSNDGIGEKSIVTSLGSDTSATSVPTVGAVKTGLDGKQDTITGTAGYVMTGTGTPGEVGAKPIYSANTNYSDSLVTAETVNTGVINAVNSSLIRVNEQGAPSDSGTLWEINTSLFAINANVPYGYTELQYIESTGTQYIDTGITGSTNAVIDMQGTARSDTTVVFMLAPINATAYQNGFGQYSDKIAGAGNTSFDIATRRIYNVSYTSNSLTVNGFTTSYYIANNANLALFGSTATNRRIANAKLYSAKIYNNDTLLRNFIPAKNPNNVIGMYDTVSGTFFTNQGNGDFTPGPSCVSPNLFDKNNTTVLNLGITANGDVGYYSTNSARYGVAVKVNPNTTYTWSFNRGTQSAYINFGESADYPTNGGACSYVGIGTSSSTYTFTTKSTTNYVYFYTTDTSFVNTMQLEQGSTATTYRPYGENICD